MPGYSEREPVDETAGTYPPGSNCAILRIEVPSQTPDQLQEPIDALDSLAVQNHAIQELLTTWESVRCAGPGGNVETRWRRGSTAKLLLQHLAVREQAKFCVVDRLETLGEQQLARRLMAAGPARRHLIDELDVAVRGQPTVALNIQGLEGLIREIRTLFDGEFSTESSELIPLAAELLGPAGERGLPSGRWVRRHSATHPGPRRRWYEKLGPLQALHAFYDHLRSTPLSGTSPDIDRSKEYVPRVTRQRKRSGGRS